VRGTVTARVGDVERTVGPGEELVIPPGVDHTFWNPGGEEAVVRWQVRPALRTERMWEELGAAKSGLAAGAVLRRHTDEFRLASPLLRAGLSLTRFRA